MKKNKGIMKCCCISLALFLLFGEMTEVRAADGYCGAAKVMCGGLVDNVDAGTHKIYTRLGDVVTCRKTNELHFHVILCTGCNTVIKSNVVGICLIKHTNCHNEGGNCQSLR